MFLSTPFDHESIDLLNGLGMQIFKIPSGEITNFPGVSADYDVPTDPALALATDQFNVAECVDQIIALLEERQLLV